MGYVEALYLKKIYFQHILKKKININKKESILLQMRNGLEHSYQKNKHK